MIVKEIKGMGVRSIWIGTLKMNLKGLMSFILLMDVFIIDRLLRYLMYAYKNKC